MKPRDYVVAQLDHQDTDPIPYAMNLEPETIAELDTYFGSSDWRLKEVPYIAGYSLLNLWPRYYENGYFRDVYGSYWQDDRIAYHMVEPALPEPTLAGYEFPSADRFIVPGLKEGCRKQLEADDQSFRIIHCGWGLHERSWHMRGFNNSLMDSIAEPEFFGELLDKLTELMLAFVEEMADLPAEGVLFGDNWGYQNGVILGPDIWRKFIKPRWARIYRAVHDQGKKTMSHCDGNVTDIMDDIVEIGLDVLESVQPEAMNLAQLKKTWGSKITFWGGMGSQYPLASGTPEDVRHECIRLRDVMGKGGGYIFGPSKPPQKGTPIENTAAMIESFFDL